MILKIAVVIAVAIVIVLVCAAVKPRTFRFQRSITIDAPPERIFPLLDDLHNWTRWSEQVKDAATTKTTFSGAPSGKDAVMEWAGQGSVGAARMLVTESLPPSRISLQVDWVKPFVARNLNEFVLEKSESSTKVTWTMQGPNLLVMRLMSVFVNMDRMMGKHFETGLANLKQVAEKGS